MKETELLLSVSIKSDFKSGLTTTIAHRPYRASSRVKPDRSYLVLQHVHSKDSVVKTQTCASWFAEEAAGEAGCGNDFVVAVCLPKQIKGSWLQMLFLLFRLHCSNP